MCYGLDGYVLIHPQLLLTSAQRNFAIGPGKETSSPSILVLCIEVLNVKAGVKRL
jgi:hypothetical protein